jgi:hypothetical protein
VEKERWKRRGRRKKVRNNEGVVITRHDNPFYIKFGPWCGKYDNWWAGTEVKL